MKKIFKASAFKVYGEIGIETIQENKKVGEGKRCKIMIAIKWL